MRANFTPIELVEKIRTLSRHEACGFFHEVAPKEVRLSASYAKVLLELCEELCEWHKIMAVLMIGNSYFNEEFVDYAIEMLCYPPWGADPWPLLEKGEDPFAVAHWASELLKSRKSITIHQFRKIEQLPECVRVKAELISVLQGRVR